MQTTINNLRELPKAAEALLKTFPQERIFAFYGAMGAGKTTLIKALGKQLALIDNVNSPSFALVNEYLSDSGESVFHFDFYRIKDLAEAQDIGFSEYTDSGSYCFIEWPEKIEPLLPDHYVRVKITENDHHSRHISAQKFIFEG